MYLPAKITPGDPPFASSSFEIGKTYLITVTGCSDQAKFTMRFGHGEDPNWYPIPGMDQVTEPTVLPVYCNGSFQVEVEGTSTDPVFLSVYPIVDRDI